MGDEAPDRLFEGLVTRTYDVVLRHVRSSMSPALARRVSPEDILQEACLNAIPHFRRRPIHDLAGFRRWLFRFAQHGILAASRRAPSALEAVRDPLASSPDPHDTSHSPLRVRGGAPMRGGCPDDLLVFALRESFALRWETVAFLLGHEDSGALRTWMVRARRRCHTRAQALQRSSDCAPRGEHVLLQ